jgi:iron complex outermembrane recepter protein
MRRCPIPLIAALLAAPVGAQEVAAELERIVVTPTRTERDPLDVPASVERVGRDQLRDAQWRTNLSEALGTIPGLVVLNRQNYAQDLQISVRGFGARSTFGVRGVRLYVDGIPATMPDGQGQVSHFPLSAAEHVEVLRGPFSALYGNSSGGVIALTTRLAPRPGEAEVAAGAGSYDSWRLGASLAGGAAPYAYIADVSRFSTAGYREHSAATRDLVTLRAAALATPLGALRVTLNVLDMPALDPLGLTREQWTSAPRQASPQALQFNTRKTTRQSQLGAHLESASGSWRTSAVTWLGTRDIVQFQAIPVAPQLSPSHPGGVIDFARVFGGVDARVQRLFGATLVTLGASIERLNEDRLGYENFAAGKLGVRGALRRDERNVVQSRDAYLQAERSFGAQWRLLAGVRASRVAFEGRDHYLANGDDSGAARFTAVNPTFGLVYRPTADSSVYAAYGRGFETPTLNELAYRADGSAGFNVDLKAARSDNMEIGAKLRWNRRLAANAAIFAVETSDDIVVRSNLGGRSSFGNAAATRRRGAEFGLSWHQSRWTLTASLAAIHATFTQPFLVCAAAPCSVPTAPVAAGSRLPGVPSYAAALAATYRADASDLTAEWRLRSRLSVNDRNTDSVPGYGVVNLSLAHPLGPKAARSRAFLRIDNVFNARYIGSVIVNEANGRFFEPAPGRSWLAGIDLGF